MCMEKHVQRQKAFMHKPQAFLACNRKVMYDVVYLCHGLLAHMDLITYNYYKHLLILHCTESETAFFIMLLSNTVLLF